MRRARSARAARAGRLRRTAAGAGLALLVVNAHPGPASAHVCGALGVLDPGQVGVVSVGVPAESSTVTAVEVHLPDGFRLDEAPAPDGWLAAVGDGVVNYTGGALAPFTCGYFDVRGVAADRGTLYFAFTTHHLDGSSSEYAGHDAFGTFPAQKVYVGPPSAAVPVVTTAPEGDHGTRAASRIGGAAAAVAALAGAIWLLRVRRRARAAALAARRTGPRTRTRR